MLLLYTRHMIEFKNATKKFGNHVVVNNINLQINGGEWISLIGQSGAGKTTLIHSLIGATKLSDGEIFVDGYNITKFNAMALQEYRRKIGIVFQDYKLLPKKTAYENIAFAMGVKFIFILLGVLGIATMWEAVFGDMGVAIIAIVNAMRVMK